MLYRQTQRERLKVGNLRATFNWPQATTVLEIIALEITAQEMLAQGIIALEMVALGTTAQEIIAQEITALGTTALAIDVRDTF
jgi:hypothetical protein